MHIAMFTIMSKLIHFVLQIHVHNCAIRQLPHKIKPKVMSYLRCKSGKA